ncbi:unnamed protein product [Rotaria magnacalcarata]|uniref:Uncharacterized protein n=1 Tax=Rotaria magnacalcarata TaxID=392030 RepID=A0A819SID5_9BILA|nr:unnamed protein product [Rotaria magnacalcarata]
MQVEEQFKEDTSGIAHSPYYGCTVRVVSKARVSYEGVLDGISANKDRIYLKNVRVNANLTAFPNRISYLDNVLNGVDKNSTSDTLNAVMIDHLTNDIHIYEQVCLTVRDIQELRLIELPSTFHESKVKLRAIDPCLVDIRLSTSDEYETKSSTSSNDHPLRAPIGRQTRGESFGSNGDSAIISSSKRNFPQQQYTGKTKNNAPFEKLSRQTSNQSLTTPSTQERLSMSRNNPTRRSTASIRSTISLPYQYGNTGDRNQMHTPLSFKESVCSYRSQRTFSGASSCSSASLDVGPHSIVQLDSSSNSLPLFEGQYDFEKANEEFRRYLELEELVIRRNSPNSSNGSGPDDPTTEKQPKSRPNSYKKEISFFDRISCTATTGTAVGYTEMDETEKNLETFGDDALLMSSSLNDNEWTI